MPAQYLYDDLFLETARRAFAGSEIIDLTTTSVGTTTTGVFAQLAYASTGATTTRFHDQWLYLRRIRGTATAGAGTTISLESGHSFATNTLANYTIKITSGTGSGQERTITSNTNADPSVVTVPTWTTNPSSDSVYEIYPSSSALPAPTTVRTSKVLTTASFTTASGTVTVAPAFTAKIVTRSDLVFCPDVHPDEIQRAINRTLSSLRFISHLPVTLIPDGDMEDTYTLGSSASFTQWWAVSSPTTAAKSTTSYPFPFGRKYIDVVTGAVISRGVQSATVAIDPNETLNVAVMLQKTPTATEVGDINVILYDVTNSAALKTVTVTGQQPVVVWFQQAPISTTEEVAIQVLASSASGSSFRVGPTHLWSQSRNRFSLDTSSVVRASDVKGLYELPLGPTTETDVYLVGEPLRPLTREVERDDRANIINIVAPYTNYPLFMQANQRWPALTYDSETTYADRDTVAQGALYYIEKSRSRRHFSSNPDLAAKHERQAQIYRDDFMRMTGIDLVEFEEAPPRRRMVRFG